MLGGRFQRIAPAGASGAASADQAGPAAVIASVSGRTVRLDDLAAVFSLITGGETGFAGLDMDVEVKARRLEALGLSADGVDLQFRHAAGEISVSRLNAEAFAGARIASTGQISDFTDRPSGRFVLSVDAADGRELAQFASRADG